MQIFAGLFKKNIKSLANVKYFCYLCTRMMRFDELLTLNTNSKNSTV